MPGRRKQISGDDNHSFINMNAHTSARFPWLLPIVIRRTHTRLFTYYLALERDEPTDGRRQGRGGPSGVDAGHWQIRRHVVWTHTKWKVQMKSSFGRWTWPRANSQELTANS